MTYSIGIDYGTSSGRVFLVDTTNGNIVSSYIKTYSHGTISETLNGQELPHHYFYSMQMIMSTFLNMA